MINKNVILIPGILLIFSLFSYADMIEEKVTFRANSSEECLLEGILYYNSEAVDAPAIIACHPHPQGGGEMNIPILKELAKRLGDRYSILLFNFRGVGHSQCSFGDGSKGVEDISGAVTFVENHPKLKPKAIFLWGYSYGSGEAFITTLQDKRVAGSVLIGFPTSYIQGFDNFNGINNKTAAMHIMIGAEDKISVGMKDSVTNFVSKNYRNIKLTVIPKADHFFAGLWGHIFEYSSDFFQGILKGANKAAKN